MSLETFEVTRILSIVAGLLDQIDDKLASLEKIAAADYAWKDYPLGTTYTMTLNPVGNGKVIKLDFQNSDKNQNIPPDDVVAIPGYPVSTIILYNQGSGVVGFSTNKEWSSVDADVQINPGETFEIKTGRPSIRRLNLVAPTSTGSQVRVLLIV